MERDQVCRKHASMVQHMQRTAAEPLKMQDLICDDAKRLFREYSAAVSMAAAPALAGRAELEADLRTAMRNLVDHNRLHHCCRTMRFEKAWLSHRWEAL